MEINYSIYEPCSALAPNELTSRLGTAGQIEAWLKDFANYLPSGIDTSSVNVKVHNPEWLKFNDFIEVTIEVDNATPYNVYDAFEIVRTWASKSRVKGVRGARVALVAPPVYDMATGIAKINVLLGRAVWYSDYRVTEGFPATLADLKADLANLDEHLPKAGFEFKSYEVEMDDLYDPEVAEANLEAGEPTTVPFGFEETEDTISSEPAINTEEVVEEPTALEKVWDKLTDLVVSTENPAEGDVIEQAQLLLVEAKMLAFPVKHHC